MIFWNFAQLTLVDDVGASPRHKFRAVRLRKKRPRPEYFSEDDWINSKSEWSRRSSIDTTPLPIELLPKDVGVSSFFERDKGNEPCNPP